MPQLNKGIGKYNRSEEVPDLKWGVGNNVDMHCDFDQKHMISTRCTLDSSPRTDSYAELHPRHPLSALRIYPPIFCNTIIIPLEDLEVNPRVDSNYARNFFCVEALARYVLVSRYIRCGLTSKSSRGIIIVLQNMGGYIRSALNGCRG